MGGKWCMGVAWVVGLCGGGSMSLQLGEDKPKQELLMHAIGFYLKSSLNWWMSDVLLMSKKQFAASFQVVHEKDARQGIAASCKSQLARPKQDPAR